MRPPDEDKDWPSWPKHVLASLQRLEDNQQRLSTSITDVDHRLSSELKVLLSSLTIEIKNELKPTKDSVDELKKDVLELQIQLKNHIELTNKNFDAITKAHETTSARVWTFIMLATGSILTQIVVFVFGKLHK